MLRESESVAELHSTSSPYCVELMSKKGEIWRSVLGNRDIVVVSPQRWGDFWVSKHWIANELSQLSRVLFIEPPVWIGGLVRSPATIASSACRVIKPLRRIDRGLSVFTPRLIPYRGTANNQILVQCKAIVQQLGIRESIVINFQPKSPYLCGKLNDAASIYYCVDPFFPTDGEESAEREMCEKSNLIYVVSESYAEHMRQYGVNTPIHVVPHGYAFEHSRAIAESDEHQRPPELAKLKGPVFGFVGSIHALYVDVDLLEYLSSRRPKYNFVLIGPHRNNPLGIGMDGRLLTRLKRLPNVHLLGPRHFLEAPKYVKYFDGCLVLADVRRFEKSSRVSKRTLFKWLMYLSQGKPVISPMMEEARSIAELVYLTRGYEDYLDSLDAALGEDSERSDQRIEYASQFSFDKVLNQIAAPLSQLLRNDARSTCEVD